MSDIYLPICYWCKYYNNIMRKGASGKCKAFPNGIPNDIWSSKKDHRQPIDGDNSIQFELIEDLNDLGDDMKILIEAAEISSETALQMAFDKLEEGDTWRWDSRYPKVNLDEDKED